MEGIVVIKDLMASTVGGMAGVMVGNPFDVIKARLQFQSEGKVTAISSIKEIMREDGPKGFLRGMLPPLIGQTLYNTVAFTGYTQAYNVMLRDIRGVDSDDQLSVDLPISVAAGTFSGFLSSFVVVPFEVIKVRLQLDHGATGIKAMANQTVSTWKSGGVKAMYSGWGATVLRDSPSTGLYFAIYYEFKENLIERGYNCLAAQTIAGGLSGLVTWTLIIPVDLIKTRLQGEAGVANPRYSGVIDCARQLVKSEGYRGFFKGSLPLMLRAFPASAVTFPLYEKTLDILGR